MVVLTRQRVAPLLSRVLVAPITTTVRDIPTEVPVGPAEGVAEGSVVNLDNAQLVPVGRLLQQSGTVSRKRWGTFCDAMVAVLGC